MAATARALAPRYLPPRHSEVAPAAHRPKLWVCAYFPDLALTAAGLDSRLACALQETVKGRPSLYAVSQAARLAGVEPSMTPAAALALCPGLQIQNRDPQLEHIALDLLADAGLDFSPWISRDLPQALLLEVSSCLRLFGGAESLSEQLHQTLAGTGHRAQLALAPSPAAAEVLARLGLESLVTQAAGLRSLLGPLPLAAAGFDDKLLQRLARTGVQTLADVWRLPRDGLARRYGPELLGRLDALAGRDSRVLRQFHRPPRFAAGRELPTELDKLDHFFPAVEQLLEQLAEFLRRRDAAVQAVELRLQHYRRPATPVELSLRHASRDPLHCARLLWEKLERTPLPAPVLAVKLFSEAVVPFQPRCFSLFDDEIREQDWQSALEQLQSRLGHQALQYPRAAAEHRPERAGLLGLEPAAEQAELPPRPLWLLSSPKPLNPAELHFAPDRERLASGWWDGAPVQRDYRIAHDRAGRKLWVFQDLKPNGGWYCHGLFG